MNEEIQLLEHIAVSYAKEYKNEYITPAHLLKALLHKDVGLVLPIETQLHKDYYFLLDWADARVKMLPKTTKNIDIPAFSTESKAVYKEAELIRLKFGLEDLTPVCLLASLATPGVGFTFEQLKSFPLTATEVEAMFDAPAVKQQSDKKTTSQSPSSFKAIQKYVVNKTEEVREGKADQIIGFEKELAIIYEILGRKTKSNVLIVGESGVGKSALITAFARRIVEEDVPEFLINRQLYELDLGAIAAEANYKGEIEDRFKNVCNEIKESDNGVLVIEAVDKLMDKQSILFGLSGLLKQELNKGSFLLICTASIDGFTKNIETDKEFFRKFEKISLDPPNDEHCFRIVKGATQKFEDHHQLAVNEDVIRDIIRLAKRYLAEKALPDSAFDLLDRSMSLLRTTNDTSEKDISQLKERLEYLKTNPDQLSDDQLMVELYWLDYQLLNKISHLITSQLDLQVDFLKFDKEQRFAHLSETIDKMLLLSEQKRSEIKSDDIYTVIAKQTGIPLGNVQSKEREKLTGGETILKKRVVGQDHAIKIILDTIFESRSGLNKKGQPMGSFFFLGPTGTGKTELAKALAEFLFQDESALLRFDMSEFKEEHSVALLYGAPPGYVGYEEGGLLVNQIRQKPYSVVLFDEIEKAHRSVFDLFLQILDEGKLHDRLGRTGDFSNALILFTSNIGSQFIFDSFAKNIIPINNELMDVMQVQL
jgi:ATP-dependent Clp protease ATP-binding subunit ClpA